MGCFSSTPKSAPKVHDPKAVVSGPPTGSTGSLSKENRFQVKNDSRWEDFEAHEDLLLKRAFLVGQKQVQYTFGEVSYLFDFEEMTQTNVATNGKRTIRAPSGLVPPKEALLPKCGLVIVTVPPGSAGTTITVDSPNSPGRKIRVNVPKGAKPGNRMAVPVPEGNETVEDVVKRQQGHNLGGKFAAGGALVAVAAGAAVGGVLLVDHITGSEFADEGLQAVEEVPDVAESVLEPTVDWIGDAGVDTGDFIENLF